MKTFRAVSALALPLACAGSTPSQTAAPAARADLMMERPRMEEHMVPSDTAGIQYDIVHVNSEFLDSVRESDHEPEVAFMFSAPTAVVVNDFEARMKAGTYPLRELPPTATAAERARTRKNP